MKRLELYGGITTFSPFAKPNRDRGFLNVVGDPFLGNVARPSADVLNNGFTAFPAVPATLFDKLDEVVFDADATKISVTTADPEANFEVRLSGVDDPIINTGHVLRARVRDDTATQGAWELILKHAGVQISGATGLGNGGDGVSWETLEFPVPAAHAALITNYATGLSVTMRVNGQFAPGTYEISQIELEVPGV